MLLSVRLLYAANTQSSDRVSVAKNNSATNISLKLILSVVARVTVSVVTMFISLTVIGKSPATSFTPFI